MAENSSQNGLENDNGGLKKRKIAAVTLVVLCLLGAAVLYFYLDYKAVHISTDDAFVDGHIHTIAPKIQGTIKNVYVDDNQRVKKGDLLVEIDPADYQVKVDETSSSLAAENAKVGEIRARVEAAKEQLAELEAGVETCRANLELQETNREQAERDAKRAEALFASEAYSKERYEKTGTAYNVSKAEVKAARERLHQAEKGVETQKAVVRQMESTGLSQQSTVRQKSAQLDTARLNCGYTKIYAPADGYITKKSVEYGNQVQAGQPLMAVAELDSIWVVANYKETDLKKIKPSQKVTIKVDSYPDREFKGTVDSIMAGTGAVFSLFPPENATGQYVKVVQRIPVKIVLDKDADKSHVLRIGMSVEPTVIVGK
jgi:membrane fusion protein (multidrug efflux system)